MPDEHIITASAAVFAIPELAELIFNHLTLTNLFGIRRTCRDWNDLITHPQYTLRNTPFHPSSHAPNTALTPRWRTTPPIVFVNPALFTAISTMNLPYPPQS